MWASCSRTVYRCPFERAFLNKQFSRIVLIHVQLENFRRKFLKSAWTFQKTSPTFHMCLHLAADIQSWASMTLKLGCLYFYFLVISLELQFLRQGLDHRILSSLFNLHSWFPVKWRMPRRDFRKGSYRTHWESTLCWLAKASRHEVYERWRPKCMERIKRWVVRRIFSTIHCIGQYLTKCLPLEGEWVLYLQ